MVLRGCSPGPWPLVPGSCKPGSCYVIGGPTASGKSNFALVFAREINGEIINGDSMQLYSHLRILTARPDPATECDIPHHLYGVLTGDQISSVAWWYQMVCDLIQDTHARGKIPIIVGGTGMYLRTLSQGLSPIPKIPESIREEARYLAKTLSSDHFFAHVQSVDSKIADSIHKNDTQRLTRALEVAMATRSSIRSCQGNPQKILDLDVKTYVFLPPREILYKRINDRFVQMVKEGALEEVAALLAQAINPESPILKAVGFPELSQYIQGSLTLDQAIALGQQSTRQYAKRQITWFTRQVTHATIVG